VPGMRECGDLACKIKTGPAARNGLVELQACGTVADKVFALTLVAICIEAFY